MDLTRKRKGSPSLEEDSEPSKRRFAEDEAAPGEDHSSKEPTPNLAEESEEHAPAKEPETISTSTPSKADRAARFAALKARNIASRKSNLQETRNESKRLATDNSQLAALARKRDIAEYKLLKAETEEAGEDFERKRAWDWTIEESQRWDERQAEKQRRREGVAFRDYREEAGKVYDRQVRELEKGGVNGAGGIQSRKEEYERERTEAIERSIKSGGLEIVEAENGELIAVDKNGEFYSTADSTSNFTNKPSREAVDRLVADIRKAEDVRLRKRRERGAQDEDEPDVTYINDKNKQFNQKLARFYNKYTADIRESFERGTAL